MAELDQATQDLAAATLGDDDDDAWWLEPECALSVTRRDGAHPEYRVVVSSQNEDRFLQSPWLEFKVFREAAKDVERHLSCPRPFPPTYSKSKMGVALTKGELEARMLGLEDWARSAFGAASRNSSARDAVPAEARAAIKAALRLEEVAEAAADEDALAAARRRATTSRSGARIGK